VTPPHEPGCDDPERVERYSVEQPSGLHARVARCLACGGQETWATRLPPRPAPPAQHELIPNPTAWPAFPPIIDTWSNR